MHPIQINKPRPRALKWGLTLLAVVAVLGSVIHHVGDLPNRPKRAAVSSVPARQAQATPTPAGLPPGNQALTVSLLIETRSQQFDRLSKGAPAEALAALKLLVPCERAELARMELAAPNPEEDDAAFRQTINAEAAKQALQGDAQCGALGAGGQRSQSVALALKAAQAGVRGGFDAVAQQEYWSAITSLDNSDDRRDPRIIEAMPAIWDAYVKAGDPHALLAMSNREDPSTCIDPPACSNVNAYQSLTHWTAYLDAGPDATVRHDGDTVTPRLSAVLTSEQAQAAIAEGHAMYANRSAK